MATIINASTAGVGGLETIADNTGILQLQTGGTNRITIDASGNVGIGTANPSAYGKFAIVGSGDIGVFSNATNSDLRINIGTSISSIVNTQNSPIAFSTNNTERVRITASGEVGIGTTPDGSALLHLGAGSDTRGPLEFTAGTLMSTPDGGTMEYDGDVLYATVDTGNRGVLSTEYFVLLQSTNTLTSQTAAQPLFDGGGTGLTNGALSLGTGTYFFECSFALSSMSATSGAFGFALGGTATKTQGWHATAKKAVLATQAAPGYTYNTAANATLVAASTATVASALIQGTIDVTVAGTIIPQVSLGVAAAAAVAAGSYFKIRRIGSATVTKSGTWT